VGCFLFSGFSIFRFLYLQIKPILIKERTRHNDGATGSQKGGNGQKRFSLICKKNPGAGKQNTPFCRQEDLGDLIALNRA